MEVYIKNEKSNIKDSDIKLYLGNYIYISNYNNYKEIEENLDKFYGSFFWLYYGDTLLFNRYTNKFEVCVINLPPKIKIVKEFNINNLKKIKGNIYLIRKDYFTFEIAKDIDYISYCYSNDTLFVCSNNVSKDILILQVFLTKDFSFFINNNRIIGWCLNNASKYVRPTFEINYTNIQSYSKNDILYLSRYLYLINKLENNFDDIDEKVIINSLKSLLKKLKKYNSIVSISIQECINNILYW